MNKINSQLNKYEHLSDDFQTEFNDILARKGLGRFENFLVSELLKEKISLVALFDYGYDTLVNHASVDQHDTATYFLVLSELKGIPHTISDWCLDATVYFENDSDFPVPSKKNALVATYEKIIRPALEKAQA